jgi:hypothetical protein
LLLFPDPGSIDRYDNQKIGAKQRPSQNNDPKQPPSQNNDNQPTKTTSRSGAPEERTAPTHNKTG